jgi:phosphoglycerate dehydrogenase-like enzyme
MTNPVPQFAILEGPRAAHYRDLAQTILGSHGELSFLNFGADVSVPERGELLDNVLPGLAAVISTPWLGGTAPGLGLPEFDDARWARAPNLRAIAGTFDFRLSWIEPDAAARRGVVLSDTSRTMTPSVAEFGLAMTLNALRRIPDYITLMRNGEWPTLPGREEGYVFGDLRGRRVRLAGYGSINRHYRELIGPFACDVRAYDPHVDSAVFRKDNVARAESLVDLAADAEIFVTAIPPTPLTHEIVDATVIDALPKGSIFILLSRMAVVAQEALWRRVRDQAVLAAIDVFDPEPPQPDSWFRRATNVLPTPHIAGNIVTAHRRCFARACEDALRVCRGEPPRFPATQRDKHIYAGEV